MSKDKDGFEHREDFTVSVSFSRTAQGSFMKLEWRNEAGVLHNPFGPAITVERFTRGPDPKHVQERHFIHGKEVFIEYEDKGPSKTPEP